MSKATEVSKVGSGANDGSCQWLTRARVEREIKRSHDGSTARNRTSFPEVRCRRIASALIGLGAVVAVTALASACRGSEPSLDPRAGLAFTRTDGQRSSVWVAKADGSDARQMAAKAFAGTLSPDGRRLAYSLPQDRPSSGLTPLYVVDLSGGKPRLIGETSGYAWSPDSARLVVSDGNALRLVEPATGKQQTLIGRVDIGEFSFAPDGKSLAYDRANGKAGREYRSDIFVVRLSDHKINQLTHDGHSDRPAWGGRWIVYRSFHFAGDWSIGRLRLIRPDGSGDRRLARGDEDPAQAQMGLDPLEVSEDGTRLLACAASEFYCPPVTFTLPDGEKHVLRVDDPAAHVVEAWDFARDGTQVLVDAGAFDDDTHHRVYALPFQGGKARILVGDATAPNWAH